MVIFNNSLDDLKFIETCGAPLTTNIALTFALAGHSDEILLYCLNNNYDFKHSKISAKLTLHDMTIHMHDAIMHGAVSRDKGLFELSLITQISLKKT